MSSGSIAAMNASLKANKRLRRNKESYSKFYKQINTNTPNYAPLSKEEIRLKREEHRLELERNEGMDRKFRFFMGIFYISILCYVIYEIAL